MSLINELLSDLEDRRGGHHHDNGVFAGLHSTDSTMARTGWPVIWHGLLIVIFVGLLALAGTTFLKREPRLQTRQEPGAIPVTDHTKNVKAMVTGPVEDAVADQRPLLKLDVSLSTKRLQPGTGSGPLPQDTQQPVDPVMDFSADLESFRLEPENEVDRTATREARPVVQPGHMSVTAAGTGSGTGQSTETGILQAARDHYEHREYSSVLELVEPYLQKSPDDVQALQLYILALIQADQGERADRELYDATLRLPEAMGLKQLYAQRLVQQGKLADAAAILYETPPRLEEAPAYYALLAAVLQQMGQHAESAAVYLQLLQRSPNQGSWWLGLAISLEKTGHRADALSAYQRALGQELSGDLRQYASARIGVLDRDVQ